MLSNFFLKRKSGPRLSPLAITLLKLAEINMSSANCTLMPVSEGSEEPEDLGRAMFFKSDGKLLIRSRAIFITTPDQVKAESHQRFPEPGDIMSLWFLHDHVPRIVQCRVDERTQFPTELVSTLDPKVAVGYKLTPLSDITKQDKRTSLRFSHQPGQGVLPVYPQILFDVFVQDTDQTFPEEGAIPSRIDQLHLLPPKGQAGLTLSANFTAEDLVSNFKQDIRTNPSETRHVHVSKPYLEEKLNRGTLVELGYSDVLGLGSEDIGRNLHIKKPLISRTKDRRDEHYLTVGDRLVLHFGARSQLDGQLAYYELVTEISKGGLENLTIRPVYDIRPEQGLRVSIADFSVNGLRFDCSPDFLDYILGKNRLHLPISQQISLLQSRVLFLDIYPRLRFNRETEVYRPLLPKRISILAKIVRCEIVFENEEEEEFGGKIVRAGVQFMYDPSEYSRDVYEFAQWERIRAFKENRYFKEVHKSLNGLIAYLESQTKEVN
jgi:hypothetical protein